MAESEGIAIVYTSVYGNTEKAVMQLKDKLIANGCPKVSVSNLLEDDPAEAVEDSFRYGKLVLATTTYNADVFPAMREFINALKERNYCNRTVALMENGSWAPMAAKVMRKMLEDSKNLTILNTTVKIKSALDEQSELEIENLAHELCS